MRIGGIQFPVFNPYKEATIEIYVSGCTRKCKGCHNPELHDFNYGDPLDMPKLLKYLKDREDLFEIISIVGGDLLCQNQEIALLFTSQLIVNFPNKKIWLFTGAKQEDCPDWIFLLFDVIKVGPFKQSVYNGVDAFPASTNQKVLIKGVDY